MKIEIDLEDSVYQMWTELVKEVEPTIQLEDFVSRVLTQIAVLIATNPELIVKIRNETPQEVREMSKRAMRPKEEQR